MASNPQFILASGNTANSDRDLAARMFESLVLEAYRTATLFHDNMNRWVMVKPISAGKSTNFQIMAFTPDTEEHVPGDELLGQAQPFDDVIISIDDRRVQHRSIAGDHATISHFDAVPPYARSMGHGLALSIDNCIVRMAIKGARTAALSNFHNGGNVVSRTGGGSTIADAYPESATGAANLRADILTLAKRMDEDNVPEMERALVLTPHGRSVLQYDTTAMLFSSDYQIQNRISDRHIGRAAGFDIFYSNNIPSTNVINSGTRSDPDKYDVDCRYVAGNIAAGTGQPIAVAMCGAREGQAGLGMTVAERLFTAIQNFEFEGVTKMVARNFFGVDIVNPWCLGEIRGQLS